MRIINKRLVKHLKIKHLLVILVISFLIYSKNFTLEYIERNNVTICIISITKFVK